MVRGADVVIENYRPGTMEKLGIGYETLKAENPALVYCAVTGFGRTGPYAGRGGFDLITQGMSGLMSVTGLAAPTSLHSTTGSGNTFRIKGVRFGPPPKLTGDQVDELRRERAAGVRIRDLVEKYGLSRASVYRLLEPEALGTKR